MLFNSLEFLIFLPTVFLLYWFVFQKSLRVQNLLLLISSYVFYGWWDYRFLSLIFLSSVIDYFVGLKIYHSNDKKKKKFFLWSSILFNLGLLGFFKYFNFFIDSWINLIGVVGYEQKSTWSLNVILPVGISFYTFQTMSYSLDIYFGKLKPTKDFISFASFVSFFPQLVAGPIERASNLLPQILQERIFKYEQAVNGVRLILWGLFKKIVIADSLAWRVDYSFDNYMTLDGGTLLLGLVYFSIQIYSDFSGYSDIAIGTSKLFGFELMSNFRFPYFSRNIREFWRRWHISLSTWFKDYLYIPLGGSKKGRWLPLRNIFITFIVSGFWHGANWTFIIWGLVHSMLYLPSFIHQENRQYTISLAVENRWLQPLKEIFHMGITYSSTMIAWVFFRSETVLDSFHYLKILISDFSIPSTNRAGLFFVLLIIILDWGISRSDEDTIFNLKIFKLRYLNTLASYFRYLIFIIVILLTLLSRGGEKNFIYFQF